MSACLQLPACLVDPWASPQQGVIVASPSQCSPPQREQLRLGARLAVPLDQDEAAATFAATASADGCRFHNREFLAAEADSDGQLAYHRLDAQRFRLGRLTLLELDRLFVLPVLSLALAGVRERRRRALLLAQGAAGVAGVNGEPFPEDSQLVDDLHGLPLQLAPLYVAYLGRAVNLSLANASGGEEAPPQPPVAGQGPSRSDSGTQSRHLPFLAALVLEYSGVRGLPPHVSRSPNAAAAGAIEDCGHRKADLENDELDLR